MSTVFEVSFVGEDPYIYKDDDGIKYRDIQLEIRTDDINDFFKGDSVCLLILLGRVDLFGKNKENKNITKRIFFWGHPKETAKYYKKTGESKEFRFVVSYEKYYKDKHGNYKKLKDEPINSGSIFEQIKKKIKNKLYNLLYNESIISEKNLEWNDYKFYKQKRKRKHAYTYNNNGDSSWGSSTKDQSSDDYKKDNKEEAKKAEQSKQNFSEFAKVDDLYKMLGVKEDATRKEIKKAYLKLSQKVHPDINKEPIAEKMFKAVNNAYIILYNEDSRRRYDRKRRQKNNQHKKEDTAEYSNWG
jgi:hypothetical protein